ncbi:MAG: CGNR zinc finger domain-containing protein [Pyrinomonadaceae bacterium]
MSNAVEPESFYIVGNNLALDFINSATHEMTGENLAEWASTVSLIDEPEMNRITQRWQGSDVSGVSLFRDRLRQIVVTLVDSKDVFTEDIGWINLILRRKIGYSELAKTADGFTKQSKVDLREPKDIAPPIIEAFVDMISFGNIEYVRKCERPDCILYFYDTTKNHKRRWCSMAICGNRAKVSKFYKKRKTRIPDAEPLT